MSCSSDSKVNPLQAQVDSLIAVNRVQKKDISEMSTFIGIISVGLDSINMYEDSIFITQNPEGKILTKEQVIGKLDGLKNLLSRQKSMIALLREQLKTAEGAMAKDMEKLVKYYEMQIEEKDVRIAELKKEIEKKNLDISQLNSRVSGLTASNSKLEKKTRELDEVLNVQDKVLNTGYVQIGTKKELKEKGLLSSKFLGKAKIQTSMLKEDKFNEVDIRMFTEVTLNSSKPKILTQMPSSSYQMTNNGDGTTTLFISDPTGFWSVSNQAR